MEAFKKRILHLIARRDYTPRKLSALAKQLKVRDEEYAVFKAAFDQLIQQGRVATGPKNLVTLPKMQGVIVGIFKANQRGFGFVIPTQPNIEGDLYIGSSDSGDAMTGDTVAAKVIKKDSRASRGRLSGVIVEVISRGNTSCIGTLRKTGSIWTIQPEGRGFFKPVVIEDATAKNARENDKVIVEIITYPGPGRPAYGVITEVLGKAGRYDSEIKAVIAQYRLPTEFDKGCLRQARGAAQSFLPDTASARVDITSDVVITIDPPDAKDFDDAISLRKDSEGNWLLGVHIADVCHFIPMGSPLDIEAKKRGNSVYLPGRVIPMLPESLSNGICSLQPGQKRFVKSVYITYDRSGRVLAREYDNSIICSAARLTYQQAQQILDGQTAGFPGQVAALVRDMEILARAIEQRRTRQGMIHLDLPETEVVFDEKGKIVDAHPADDSYTHTIIEMFMVEANEAVAVLLDRFNVPFIRRIHPDPSPASVKEMSHFIKLCGMKIPRRLDRSAIQDILLAVKGKPCSYAVNMHVLRSMQRAEYSPLHIGHFALASNHYCHFTSPIRRYADLMVHRLTQCYIERRLNMIGLEEALPDAVLIDIGRHITFTEQQADNAENDLKTILILQMLTEHIGDQLDCVVSGLTNFGIFVQCRRLGIEALIEPGDLGLDEWRFDQRSQTVIGKYSRKSIHLGQEMKVTIAAVNLPARQLIVAPSKPLIEPPTTAKSQHKPPAQQHRKRKPKR